MADPIGPHLMGIILDGTGVATSKVIATNRSTGKQLIDSTDSNKLVIFNADDFEDDYENGDVIEFENVGASKGGQTITIDTTGGFQEATIAAHAASTTQVVI